MQMMLSLSSSIIIIIALQTILSATAAAGPLASQSTARSPSETGGCYFTPNRGQWDERVLFRATVGDAVFFFGRTGPTIFLIEKPDDSDLFELPRLPLPALNEPPARRKAALVEVEFVGANPGVQVIGDGLLSFYHNYFLGNDPSRWRTHVPNYSSIIYKDIYPGIDIAYHGAAGGIKYDVMARPGADISQVAMRYGGIDELSLSEGGSLEIKTARGTLLESVPAIYQLHPGGSMPLTGNYSLKNANMVGFEINGDYDAAYPIVIDPELLFSTFLGGSSDEIAHGVGIDFEGFCIVSGGTWSSDFPRIDPLDSTYGGYGDIFISKFTPEGDSLVFSTFIGSSGGNEFVMSLALDDHNYIYACGTTNSPDFPVVNPYDDDYDLNQDAIVLKMSPLGDSLLYSTYLGAGGGEDASDIAVDDEGCAYVVGTTSSIYFPMLNPYDGEYGSTYDAFLTKFTPEGDSLVFSTFLGGTGPQDGGYAVAVDAEGCAYVAGVTQCTDFPTLNAFDSSFSGGQGDAFLTKFTPGGDSLVFSTYLGGADEDFAVDISLDMQGAPHVIGVTYSTDFPAVNAFSDSLSGGEDIFVTGFTTTGDSLVFSTYLGGSGDDEGLGIGLDGSGNVHVSGATYSDDFPVFNAFDSTFNGQEDVACAWFSHDGTVLLSSTYLGGSGSEYIWDMAVNSSGQAYVTGLTDSQDFPVVNAYQPELNGWADVFVAKFSTPSSGCLYLPGDINGDGQANGGDVSYAVNYFKGFGSPPPVVCQDCPNPGQALYGAGDVNSNCQFNGVDITYFVNFLKGVGPALSFCPDCPPSGR